MEELGSPHPTAGPPLPPSVGPPAPAPSAAPTRRLPSAALTYVVLAVVPAVLVVVLLPLGAEIAAHGKTAAGLASSLPANTITRLLVAVVAILLACQAVAWLFGRLGQPEVIGQMLAGFMLGPSLLGAIWPQAFRWLFPASLSAPLNALAQLGLILFMFIIGYELDPALIRGHGRVAVTVSHVSIAMPFLSGIILAFFMYRPLADPAVGFVPFALFVAISLSITAFPVMASILRARGIDGTPLGTVALTCAATDDVTGWCLLALVVAESGAASGAAVVRTVALTAAFVAVMLGAVRPALRWLLPAGPDRATRLPAGFLLPLMLCLVLLSALTTSAIGVQPIFGAFLAGFVMPRRPKSTGQSVRHIRYVTVALLLPLFFAYTGLKTQLGMLGTHWHLWAWCGAIIVTAVVGKGVASAVAARLTGLSAYASFALGALMNCRGLTALIVLDVGLSLRVISATVFTMLVVNALVATIMTTPLLGLAARIRGRPADPPCGYAPNRENDMTHGRGPRIRKPCRDAARTIIHRPA